MAQYIGYVQGQRGDASRLGTKNSGLSVKGSAWNVGGRVQLWYDNDNERDVCSLFLTSGSNGHSVGHHIGDFHEGMSTQEIADVLATTLDYLLKEA